MNLNDFLVWLANSGGSIIVLSWIAERWAWFQAQKPDAKQYMFFGGSVLVSAASYTVLHYVPASILTMLTPWFGLVYASFVTVFISKAFHALDKKS